MNEQQIRDEIKPFVDAIVKNGYWPDGAIDGLVKRISAISTVSMQLSEISVKACMIVSLINSNRYDERIEEYANDCRAASGRISEMLGLTAAQELTLELTRMLDEHPEGWEGPCECNGCLDASR